MTPRKPISFLVCGLLLCVGSSVWAQFAVEEAEWKESATPPPPAFDAGKQLKLEVSPNSSLVYGIDPASISISKSDGLVRYVLVASHASGARNVMYEGLRCATGEFKTYARHSAEEGWRMVSDPQWRSMFGNLPSRHALRLAQAGACDNAAVPASAEAVVSRLKSPTFRSSP